MYKPFQEYSVDLIIAWIWSHYLGFLAHLCSNQTVNFYVLIS